MTEKFNSIFKHLIAIKWSVNGFPIIFSIPFDEPDQFPCSVTRVAHVTRTTPSHLDLSEFVHAIV